MKRRIVIGLALLTVLFLLAGGYIARTIHAATGNLDRLIALHQVETLRKQYLLQMRRMQSDLQGPTQPTSAASLIADVREMRGLIDSCFGCHHSAEVTGRLVALRRDGESYQLALEQALARRQEAWSPLSEEEPAFQLGASSIARVREVIDETATALERNTHRALGDIARTRYVLYAVLGLGPLLAAALAWAFISGLTRPLGVLLDSTRRLKRGELDHRVAGLRDEFGELGVAFNEMAGSLKEQLSKMQRTEQMAVAGQLAAGLAHEIKNPLGGIKVAMQVLSSAGHLPEADRRVLWSVIQEVGRVESLMAQLLHFARPAKPQPVALDLNDVVDMTLGFHALTRPAPLDRSPDIQVVKDLQPVPATLADPVQLQQVLLNLVLNAVDSMPSGGVLEVRTGHGEPEGTLHMTVSDTGRGIPAENAARLFQPFFTTKPRGTGLGLATSKQLVEGHGGSISVSANPAGGTIFRVQLPLVPPATTVAA